MNGAVDLNGNGLGRPDRYVGGDSGRKIPYGPVWRGDWGVCHRRIRGAADAAPL
jgi:hypothetical protein